MATETVQPQPGRRPVYPVDSGADSENGPGKARSEKKPVLPALGAPEDPASDENTESANHPNDE